MPDSHYLVPPPQLMDFRLIKKWGSSLCWWTVAANVCVRTKCSMGFTDCDSDLGQGCRRSWFGINLYLALSDPSLDVHCLISLLVYSDLMCVFDMQVWHTWCMAPEVGDFQPQLEALEVTSRKKIIITVKLGRWRDYSCSHKNVSPFFSTGGGEEWAVQVQEVSHVHELWCGDFPSPP